MPSQRARQRGGSRESPKIDRARRRHCASGVGAAGARPRCDLVGAVAQLPDDHEMLTHGMVMYDALYRWCKEGQDELHTWNPQLYRTGATAVK